MMNVRKGSVVLSGVVFCLGVVALTFGTSGKGAHPSVTPSIRLLDDSNFDDRRYRSGTFSLLVADFNNDSRDDILIGAHNQNPVLLINSGAGFADQSGSLFPAPSRSDRHGYTAADFDNDGRLDIAIAGGGADGVGKGWSNLLFRNESESGLVRFVQQQVSEDFALTAGRSRAFIPLASEDGRAVDLYYATLKRQGYNNRLFRNSAGVVPEPFAADGQHYLSRQMNDAGRGALADLDGDGGIDYLVVEGAQAKIYWHRDRGAEPTVLTGAAQSAVLADFDNDGLLDVFVGRAGRSSRSDLMTVADDEAIFTMHKNGDGDYGAASFRVDTDPLAFNLNQWVTTDRKQRLKPDKQVFLGSTGAHPLKRQFTVSQTNAGGKPTDMSAPGMYVWFSGDDEAWHVRWVFGREVALFKGSISGVGLKELARENFHLVRSTVVKDQLFMNRGEGRFTVLAIKDTSHDGVTQGATVADFNSDGWLDVLGVRHAEQGDKSPAPFLLTNLGPQRDGGLGFSHSLLPLRERDYLHRADHVVHGFFNDDELPDAFLTNGYGQLPGNNGAPRLLLNDTEAAGKSLLVSLRGSTANRFGLGAEVKLYRGDTMLGFRVAGLNINTSQDTSWLHFGLGAKEGPYRLAVEWPDGRRSEHEIAGEGRIEVVQPQ